MLGPLTYLDAFLIAICFISGILAMYRGLSREVLSLVSWGVAAGATAYFVLFQKKISDDIASQVGVPPIVVQLGVGALLFVIVLLIVHLFTARISDAILDSRIGLIDRIGGFAFGVARGFLIVLPLFMFYHRFYPESQQHLIVLNAKSRPMLLSADRALQPLFEQIDTKFLNKSKGDQRAGSPAG
jgi:membrane protein required for colicin V production